MWLGVISLNSLQIQPALHSLKISHSTNDCEHNLKIFPNKNNSIGKINRWFFFIIYNLWYAYMCISNWITLFPSGTSVKKTIGRSDEENLQKKKKKTYTNILWHKLQILKSLNELVNGSILALHNGKHLLEDVSRWNEPRLSWRIILYG